MYDGEDTQMTPPASTDAPAEETVMDPQEPEQPAPQADEASETPAQA